jgi:transcriptional regulator with XRE-family HTH domain
MPSEKRSAVIYPKNQHILTQLGENIRLARKRRKYTQTLISERSGMSRLTIRKIERGDPTVSLGHYITMLGILNLAKNLTKVASDDELGRKLQDIALMSKK